MDNNEIQTIESQTTEQGDYVTENKIGSFFGEYRFLSNFWEAPVTYEGITYTNNEAAFQAQKCIVPEEKTHFITMSPQRAKSRGRKVALRPDWEEVKLVLMEEIVRAKFTQNPDLKEKLLATGDMILEEGNKWGDTFWGVSLRTGRGNNHLGRILMKVRDELRQS